MTLHGFNKVMQVKSPVQDSRMEELFRQPLKTKGSMAWHAEDTRWHGCGCSPEYSSSYRCLLYTGHCAAQAPVLSAARTQVR
jgi:hypothetical protein